MKESELDFVNIVDLPIKPRFSDSDVTSLFMGLCKLVKRLANENAELEFNRRFDKMETSFKKEISNLQEINKGLLEELRQKTNLIK